WLKSRKLEDKICALLQKTGLRTDILPADYGKGLRQGRRLPFCLPADALSCLFPVWAGLLIITS
ncbi:MAG: hypothetical protein ACSW8K_12970, partial [bacterium]